MSNLLEAFEKNQIEKLTGKKRIPTFRPGDTLKVTIRITEGCLLYTSPSPRDKRQSRMPSSA